MKQTNKIDTEIGKYLPEYDCWNEEFKKKLKSALLSEVLKCLPEKRDSYLNPYMNDAYNLAIEDVRQRVKDVFGVTPEPK